MNNFLLFIYSLTDLTLQNQTYEENKVKENHQQRVLIANIRVLAGVKDTRITTLTRHSNDSVSPQFKKEKEQVWCNELHDNTSYQP